MKGNAKVVKRLNEVLTNELTAIDQYFVHAKMFEHAEALVERLLFLEGLPNVQRPQPRPTPSPCARSSGERAPCSAARTIWRSVIALQMQMYMTNTPLEPASTTQATSVSPACRG
jgi:hypothetical protein